MKAKKAIKNHTVQSVVKKIQSLANPAGVEGMAYFGITAKKAYGLDTPTMKMLAKEIGKNHDLALKLWATGIFDARAIAMMIDEPAKVTNKQMESWVKDFDSWAICDGTCLYLFGYTPFAWKKAFTWSKRKEEYVKRAGFTLMATLAVHDKKARDEDFIRCFPALLQGATDERNFVKKAVNWALRQIGKRNLALNKAAIEAAKEIQMLDSKSARWIAADALRELQSDAVLARLRKKGK